MKAKLLIILIVVSLLWTQVVAAEGVMSRSYRDDENHAMILASDVPHDTEKQAVERVASDWPTTLLTELPVFGGIEEILGARREGASQARVFTGYYDVPEVPRFPVAAVFVAVGTHVFVFISINVGADEFFAFVDATVLAGALPETLEGYVVREDAPDSTPTPRNVL